MTWAERTSKISVGDQVAVSRRFLRSINCYTGDLANARGTVTELKKVGEILVATVDWQGWDVAPRILAGNLSRVTKERGVMDVD